MDKLMVTKKEQDKSVASVEQFEQEDQSLIGVMILPTYDNVNEQKVLKNVVDVFRGFDHTSASSGKLFKDTDALAVYTQNTMDDIKDVRQRAERTQLCQKAAAMARFWYLGETINNALVNGEYGTAAVNKLATALKKSVPYIYQLRAVAVKLSVIDCYLLGIRGLDSTHLRRLAQIQDDNVRASIVKAFIDKFKDTSNISKLDQAKKQLLAAVNIAQNTETIDISSSDPENVTTPDVSEIPSECLDVMNQLTSWQRMFKKPATEDVIETFCKTLEDFYITSAVPDADAHLANILAGAVKTKDMLLVVRSNIDDAIRELDSLQGVTVCDPKDISES